MADNEKQPLFRKKSIDVLNAPGESLNSYLRVATPGMWMILSAVILMLAGIFVWGALAHIHTEVSVSIKADANGTICYVPESAYNAVLENHTIQLDGADITVLNQSGEPIVINDSEDSLAYGAGKLEAGTVVVPFKVDAELKTGTYEGSVVTEDITPISFLFNR